MSAVRHTATHESSSASSAWVAAQVREKSAAGIAATVARLVRSGELTPETRLPTVRALAQRLGVSPATVSAAWASLRKQRIISGDGRQGTWILAGPSVPRPARYENIAHLWPSGTLNLTRAIPDPALLPNLRDALTQALADPMVNSYEVAAISEPLRRAVEVTWPFASQAWLAVNGGYEGIQLVLSTTLVAGDYVAIEDPATPRLLDIIDGIGARPLPVGTDRSGPDPQSLRSALRHQPAAFVYEPRSSSRLSSNLTAQRRDELAAILSDANVLVIEDDGLGELSCSPYHGLGNLLPDATVLVRSYSKSHGPDLRMGVLGGAGEPIERARIYRTFGPGWTSLILQNALAWLLTDAGARESVVHARETYRQRRERFSTMLAERDVQVPDADGLAVWVPVLNEHQAQLVLASHGIAVATAGESWTRPGPPAIRVATGLAIPNEDAVADRVALAVLAR